MIPTKTINKIHFDDLSHSRFEDLSLALVYRISRWVEINHFGRKGRDEGIDIYAVENLENETQRVWFIQCKRYKSISKSELSNVVTNAVNRSKKMPDILLLIIACDVSKKYIEYFNTIAIEKGVKRSIIWAASILETKLYTEHHDLLFAYFGISLSSQRSDRIASLRRNIRLKNRMIKDFPYKIETTKQQIRKKLFEYTEVTIHSIDDTFYPNVDPVREVISSWFKVELFDFYYNGMEVILNIQYAIFDENHKWDIINRRDEPRKKEYKKCKVFVIGRIPYENIIDYDLNTDEFGFGPHIYCDFRNNGEPYEEIVYSLIGDETNEGFDVRLNNEDRIQLP